MNVVVVVENVQSELDELVHVQLLRTAERRQAYERHHLARRLGPIIFSKK